jgi:hypothetical protein
MGQEYRSERDTHCHKDRSDLPLAICRRSLISFLGLRTERVLQADLHEGSAGADGEGRVRR